MTRSSLGELRGPLLRQAQRLWRAAPVSADLRALAGGIAAGAIRRRRFAGPPVPLRPGPVVVSGYLSDALGIGSAGRLTADALAAAGFDVTRHDVRPVLDLPGFADRPLPGAGGIWLIHANAPEALHLMDKVRRADLYGRYRIGYWAWELPRAPRAWLKAARLFDEIWVPSQFVADSLAGCGTPVRVAPHPVPIVSTVRPEPARFGFDASVVNFLAMADLRSSAARKNPLGAVEAFRRAFPEPQGVAALTLKLVKAGFDAAARRRLETAIGGRPDIRLLLEEYPPEQMQALIASADVFVSLHRAEGFGLGPAEALALGRAALATGWSGNLQFMAGLDDALIPYRLVAVRDSAGVYGGRGQHWAEPDLDAAARAIRRLSEDAALRRRIGEQGRRQVATLSAAWSRPALDRLPFAAYAASSASG